MKRTITFLEAPGVPLTKEFTLVDGKITATPYPLVSRVTSHEREYHTLSEFAQLIREHSRLGHCLWTGTPARPLVNESRKGMAKQSASTDLLILDIDGVCTIEDPDELVNELGLGDIDYLLQYSASHGVPGKKGVRAHLYFLIEEPVDRKALTAWLQHQNLSCPSLRSGLALGATGRTLTWLLDTCTAQNARVIYIARPILGEGVVADIAEEDQIQLRAKSTHMAFVGLVTTRSDVSKAKQEKLNELRKSKGLSTRGAGVTIHGSTIVVKDPGPAKITVVERNDEMTRVNLGSGDSGAYWHFNHNPYYLYSFKDEEEVYLIRDIDPDYYASLGVTLEHCGGAKDLEDGRICFGIKVASTDTYHHGHYNPVTGEFSMFRSGSKDKLSDDVFTTYGVELGERVNTWRLTFDPHTPRVVDVEGRAINMWHPSRLLADWEANPRAVAAVPPTLAKLVANVLGSKEAQERFLNWAAFVVQKRRRSGQAWGLVGTTGTGKSVLSNLLCAVVGRAGQTADGREILGAARSIPLSSITDRFNDELQNKILVYVDDADAGMDRAERRRITSDMKPKITDSGLSVEAKFQSKTRVPNFCNFLFTTNVREALHIDANDRRISVSDYSETKLTDLLARDTIDAIERLEHPEIADFVAYLMTREVDEDRASRPLENQQRADMIAGSRDPFDAFLNSIEDLSLVDIVVGDARYSTAIGILDAREAAKRLLTGLESGMMWPAAHLRELHNCQAGNAKMSANLLGRAMSDREERWKRRHRDTGTFYCVKRPPASQAIDAASARLRTVIEQEKPRVVPFAKKPAAEKLSPPAPAG